ncbi:MAG TPA: glycosyltransferase family 4 protein [Vicinamibacterales bacterium]|jgi:type III pantothenate kinase
MTDAAAPPRARVAVVSTFYPPVLGGAETAARGLASYLARRGHRVVVITKRTDPALPDRDVIDDVPVERVGPRGPRRAGSKWAAIPAFFSALVRHRAEIDAIAVVDYRGIGIAALAAGAVLRCPVVVQAQTEGVLSCANWQPALDRLGLSVRNPFSRAASWPLRRLYRLATAFACISRGIEREALDEGVPRARVHYLPNTVDIRRFHPASPDERHRLRADLGWPDDGRPIGIFVGRLSREKGVVDLLQAWQRLGASRAHLVVVGPDMAGNAWDEGPAVRALAGGPDLAGRVTLAGSSDDPAPLYRGADFAVQPSHWESFGLSAAEAMASGLPIVASAVGGLTDFIVDGTNGLLVPPRDPAALASAIERIAAQPALRERLGAAAAAAMRDFDEERVFETFGALLDRLADVR